MSERGPEEYDRDFAEIVGQIEASRMKEPERGWLNLEKSIDAVEVPEPDEAEWKPAPLPASSGPTLLGGIGWACAAYALVVFVLALARISLPFPLGHLGVVAFVAALVIGFVKLPKNRTPFDGDGAVV